MDFQDRVVWITGASSGIGAALAEAFAAAGARCVLSARRLAELDAVRTRCAHPERHRVVALDLTDFASHAGVAADVGPVDIVVHNGGISQRSRVIDTDLSVIRRIMDVNFTGTVSLTQAVLPAMRARRSGHIVVISSLVGHISTPGRAAYSASKHALHGFFEAVRAEEADHGVFVTLVCPGYVRTEISLHALRADGTEHAAMDSVQENGMAADVCAARILKAVDRRKAEVTIAGPERIGVFLFRYFPWMYRRLMRRYAVS